MNTPLSNTAVRHVIVVTLLSVACAFCSGCHSSVKANAMAPASAAAVQAKPWQSQAPAAPLDERPITPMETVGASAS